MNVRVFGWTLAIAAGMFFAVALPWHMAFFLLWQLARGFGELVFGGTR